MILQVQVSIVDGGGTRNSTFFRYLFLPYLLGLQSSFSVGVEGWLASSSPIFVMFKEDLNLANPQKPAWKKPRKSWLVPRQPSSNSMCLNSVVDVSGWLPRTTVCVWMLGRATAISLHGRLISQRNHSPWRCQTKVCQPKTDTKAYLMWVIF